VQRECRPKTCWRREAHWPLKFFSLGCAERPIGAQNRTAAAACNQRRELPTTISATTVPNSRPFVRSIAAGAAGRTRAGRQRPCSKGAPFLSLPPRPRTTARSPMIPSYSGSWLRGLATTFGEHSWRGPSVVLSHKTSCQSPQSGPCWRLASGVERTAGTLRNNRVGVNCNQSTRSLISRSPGAGVQRPTK
jgi:hypothetical protein